MDRPFESFFYMSDVKREHPKLKVPPFAARHFVDVGSGDIFLVQVTILEFHGQTELYPMDVNCGHVLLCKKQTKQKKKIFIMLV